MNIINYGSQFIDKSDIVSVSKTLKNEKITTGPKVKEFENKIKKFLNCKYAITCNSGTSALFIAYQALNVNKNSIIIMPSINFIASYRVAKFFTNNIFLSDVDSFTGQMTPELLSQCIKKYKLKKVDIVNTMYLGGNPYFIKEFYKMKKKFKFMIVEDSCHAFGAQYKIKNKTYKIGSCKHSDVSTFSFHPLKTITTGEGGLVTTNNKNLYLNSSLIRSHGIQRNFKSYWKNQIEIPGMNFRMSDLNAALGITQLRKVSFFIKKRRKISQKYNEYLGNFSNYIKPIQNTDKNFFSANHLKILHFNFKKLKCKKDDIFNFFLKRKIFLQFHYRSINEYKIFNSKSDVLNGARKYCSSAISFPIHPKLNAKQIDLIFNTLKNLIKKYKK